MYYIDYMCILYDEHVLLKHNHQFITYIVNYEHYNNNYTRTYSLFIRLIASATVIAYLYRIRFFILFK